MRWTSFKPTSGILPQPWTIDSRKRGRAICTIAVVILVHLIIVTVFMRFPTMVTLVHPRAAPLELLFLVNKTIVRPSISDKPSTVIPAPSLKLRSRSKSEPDSTTMPPGDNAIAPPIDWAGELAKVGKSGVPSENSQGRDFGFPNTSNESAIKAPEFGWSHAQTHRVEAASGGGIVIHLNDNCVIVLLPVPIAGCKLGKHDPNGQLFEHMHDPPPADNLNPSR